MICSVSRIWVTILCGSKWLPESECIMNKPMAEAKVLKALDIPDFRHMTKDKVVSFVSMLPNMDPEVAKKALEQFPEFAKTTLEIVERLKASIDNSLEGNSANMAEFNGACRVMLDALEVELHKDGLSTEEKADIAERMTQVLDMMYRKDSENKEFLRYIVKGVVFFGACLAVTLASALGIKASANWDDKER